LNSPLTADEGGVGARYDCAVANANLMIVDIFIPHMRGLESIRIFSRTGADRAVDRHVRL
jgi:hypothetical protein